MISSPPDAPLGVAVWVRRLLAVLAIAFFVVAVLTVKVDLGTDPFGLGYIRLLFASLALAGVLPSFVWLHVDEDRVIVTDDELWAPTMFGWRRVSLRPLRASVMQVQTQFATERHWRLAHGWQPIIINAGYFRPIRASEPGGKPWTLEDVISGASGVPVPKESAFAGLGGMLVLLLAWMTWIGVFGISVTLWIMQLAGIH